MALSPRFAALAVDQAAKHWVAWTLAIGESWPQQGPFQLTHVANTGGAYSLFSGHTVGLIVFSAIGLGVLFVLYWPHPKTGLRAQLSFGLMIAGMTGNLVDRVVFGHVIDFIRYRPLVYLQRGGRGHFDGSRLLRLRRAGWPNVFQTAFVTIG